MKNRLTKGYRVLFHGPPGTGKTLTATLLGKYTGRDVYRIDLSMVVSKYIGETEKNLENLFAKAEAKHWILFFDEADSLFGKRTNVRDAHDKYANQEVSYLLQRVEDFDGLVILATNMKNNIDDAFIRRFNSIIKFSMPDENERVEIWRKCFPSRIRFEEDKDLPQLVKKYELSGGNITNIVQYACLKAIEKKGETIYLQDVLNGIKREMHKEGKPFSN
jgi:SpoVK/Ycf46/Vps4 family AAA+-type ATPase